MLRSVGSFPVALCFFSLLFISGFESFAFQQNKTHEVLEMTSYYDVLPPGLPPPEIKKPIIIAVVDDGLRLSHKDFQGLLFTNEGDKGMNRVDDDGNGKRDDVNGWDCADNDNDVNPPEGLESNFFHGTFISGSIVRLVKLCFGAETGRLIRILPVKVLSDNSKLPDYSIGYEGVKYASEMNADIIVCAWSGGTPDPHQREIVQHALDKGVMVIGSAGNAYTGSPDPPGSLPGVLTVAGVDSLIRKTSSSNYGGGVELVAPAWKVKAAYPLADNSYFYGDGTSGAAGIVAGCAAVLKILYPDAHSEEIIEALINTAVPVDEFNPEYAGRLGAGMVRLEDAVEYLEDPSNSKFFNSGRTMGKIRINKSNKVAEWVISPNGAYEGIRIMFEEGNKLSRRSNISFYNSDSLWFSSNLTGMPEEVFIPGDYARIEYDAGRFNRDQAILEYESIPVDSSTIYCSGTQHYQYPEASVSDGSGKDNYANNSSCKWQITAAPGQRIILEFDEFSTQPNVDFLYLFDGESTIPGNLIAKFSGHDIPIKVVSRTNKLLIWFVTDSSVTDLGWKLEYRFVD